MYREEVHCYAKYRKTHKMPSVAIKGGKKDSMKMTSAAILRIISIPCVMESPDSPSSLEKNMCICYLKGSLLKFTIPSKNKISFSLN